MTDAAKKADKAADKAPAPPHHVRARVFALEHLMMRVTLSNLPAEAKKLEKYILGARAEATPEQVEARIMAIRVTAKGQISQSNVVREAQVFERYILTGEAPAPAKRAEVPEAAEDSSAGDRTQRGSEVPGKSGEASEQPRPQGRPSQRVAPHEVI